MSENILLTICIPTYNNADYLKGTISSIIEQIKQDKLEDIEILVSDNASKDKTPEIMEDFIKKYPKLVTYHLNQKNVLFNGNMIVCIKKAKGKYIHFLGDDDFYIKGGLKRLRDVCLKTVSYDMILLSNNWLNENTNKIENRAKTDKDIFGNDMVFQDKTKLLKEVCYRIWCVSNLVIKKSLANNIENYLPQVKDWIQLGICMYIAKVGKNFYCFSAQNPVITIRLYKQKWLNNNDAPLIYYNNLKTMSYAHHFGIDKSFFEEYKTWFFSIMKGNPYFLPLNNIQKIKMMFLYFPYYGLNKNFYKMIGKKAINQEECNPDYTDLEVIVLTYNRAEMLRQMLISLCNQTVKGFKIIVLDNHSTDNTKEVIQEIKQEYKDCLITHIRHEKNIGNYENFKYSQKIATKTYCAIFHDDDIIHPEYLEYAIRNLARDKQAVMAACYTENMIFPDNNDWHLFCGAYYKYETKYNALFSLLFARWPFATMIYKTEVYKKVEYKPELYGKLLDIAFLTDMSTYGNSLFLRDVGVRYRQHQSSDTSNHMNGPFLNEVVAVIKNYQEKIPQKGLIKKLALYQFSGFLFRWAKVPNTSIKEFYIKCEEEKIFTALDLRLLKIKLVRKVLKIGIKIYYKRKMKRRK